MVSNIDFRYVYIGLDFDSLLLKGGEVVDIELGYLVFQINLVF